MRLEKLVDAAILAAAACVALDASSCWLLAELLQRVAGRLVRATRTR